MLRRRCCSHCSFVASYAHQYPCFSTPAKKACHPTAMIFTIPIRNRLSLWTHCERPRLAVRRTWGDGDAPASLLFTLLSRGQLHTPVPLFQRTRQKGLSPRCRDFYEAHQKQVELMDALQKASLGGKTHMVWWWCTGVVAIHIAQSWPATHPSTLVSAHPSKMPFTPLP